MSAPDSPAFTVGAGRSKPVASAAQPEIPVLANARLRGFPKHEKGGAAHYVILASALTTHYSTDAHTAAYSVPDIKRRLTREAMTQIPGGVVMVTVFFDMDASDGHGAEGASDEWWAAEKAKIGRLLEAHPGAFIYRTRGGYRVVYLLAVPFVIRTPEDAAAWKARYLGWTRYLARRFNIVADPACNDWQRLYRLPHATRTEGGQPEHREVIGDATAIGEWVCELAAEDMVAPPKQPKLRQVVPDQRQHVGRGRLVEAFANKGWLGGEIETGKYAARCPWVTSHSKGEDLDGSTVVYTAGNSDLGWWHCSHAHCADRGMVDVLGLFTDEELGNPPKCGARTGEGRTCRATDLLDDRRCLWHSSTEVAVRTRAAERELERLVKWVEQAGRAPFGRLRWAWTQAARWRDVLDADRVRAVLGAAAGRAGLRGDDIARALRPFVDAVAA